MMNRADVLQAAKEAVESRGKAYAPPNGNFRRIAALWEPILGIPVEPHEVALCLAALKIARLVEADGDHPDSWIDLAGYAACGAEVTTEDDNDATS